MTMRLVPPTITVSGDLAGWEFPGDPAQFIITRAGGSLSQYFAQSVRIELAGDAEAGADYAGLPQVLTIPAGQSLLHVIIEPVDDEELEGTEQVILAATDVAMGGLFFALAAPQPAAGVGVGDNDFSFKVREITYGSDKPPAFHLVMKDDGTGAYPSPHWLDNDLDGKPENSSPLSYTISNSVANPALGEVRVTANVKLVLTGPSDLTYLVRAKWINGPYCASLPAAATLAGTTLAVSVTSTKPLPDTIQHTAMGVFWEVSVDDGRTWKSDGSTQANFLYGSIQPGDEFRTVLHVDTRNAKGLKSPMGGAGQVSVLDAIWGDFHNPIPGVLNWQGNELRYYGQYADSDAYNLGDNTTAGLLKYWDGRCGAWARFLLDVWRTQGINIARLWAIDPNPARTPPSGYPILVGIKVKKMPGQGIRVPNARRDRRFRDHAVVGLTGSQGVYDPSYGEWSPTPAVWQTKSLEAIVYSNSSGTGHDDPLTGSNDVIFIPQ